jgi:hypothetical protein
MCPDFRFGTGFWTRRREVSGHEGLCAFNGRILLVILFPRDAAAVTALDSSDFGPSTKACPRHDFRHLGVDQQYPPVFCTLNGGGRVTLTGLVILLLVLAPLLQGLGIEVRHHGTFLARLAFTLIGLAAFSFHLCPSLPTAA